MNCANHPEAPAVAYCRTCGKPLCVECKREAHGTVFCAEHAPIPVEVPLAAAQAPPVAGSSYTPPSPPTATSAAHVHPPPAPSNSPAIAFLLGLIPGVGAIYNGQYAKGLIHAVVFGIMISILNSHPPNGVEPLVGILMSVWFFYMAFEAYHTARKRRDGQRVDEFSSLVDLNRSTGRFPVGAVILIVLGVVLLLDQMDVFRLDRMIRFWPVGLIAIGVYMLYVRLEGSGLPSAQLPSPEVPHERR